MKFSKKSEYGLRALLELTQSYDDRPMRRSELSEKQQIPLGFLEGILLSLKHAGVLASRPGVDGGYRLIKAPEKVSLGQIIRTLDGPLAPIPCVSQTAYQTCQDCPYAEDRHCPIQTIMLEVRNAISSILDHYTLRDFSKTSMKPKKHRSKRTVKKSPTTKSLIAKS